MGRASKSPWVIHYDASSCNGCDIEVLATFCPGYDAERFGIINTGNPKHADIFLVTGSVNKRNSHVVKEIYNQILEPKVVIACGACACTGGIFKDCYNIIGGIDKIIPVDVYIPGCAIRPEAIVDAIMQGATILDKKLKAFKAGTLPIKPGNDWLTDEEYEAQKERELREEDGTEAFEKEYEKNKAKKNNFKGGKVMSLRCTFQTIDKVDSLNKAQEMAWKGYSFVQLLATRTDNGIDMVYTYRNGEDMPSFKIKNIKETDSIASITPVFFNAFVFENEVHDLFGVRIQGICIDFKGRFYDVTVDKSMTVVSPELKKRKDRKAKVAKAKSVSFSKKNNESSIDKNSKVHKEEAR